MDLIFLYKFLLIFLDVQYNLSPSVKSIIFNLWNLELSIPIWTPFMCRTIFDSRNYIHMISNNERRIESNTKLPDDIILAFSFLLHFFHKLFRTTFSNGSKFINEVLLRHTDTIILNNNLTFIGKYLNVDHQIFIGLSLEPLFFKSIWGIR